MHALIADPSNELFFSPVSLWEVAIKHHLGRKDFSVDPLALYHGLLKHSYYELAVNSLHAIAVDRLPSIHKDPFDRLLIAQTMVEGIALLTCDTIVAQYLGPSQQVQTS